MNFDLKVMHRYPLIDVEAPFVLLVGDTVSDSTAKHHLGALHVVVHDVLEFRLKRLLVDEVKVNMLLVNHLDPDISFDEVDVASDVKLAVLNPLSDLLNFVILLLEEQNLPRASNNEGFSVDEHHLP